jgi:GH15 family glucan-1,4-alpha-glucosidase
MPKPPFAPLRRQDGYPPLEDLGLIGDGTTAALVCRDGSIPWLCVPRFDSPPLLAGLLDARRGGALVLAPEGASEGRQHYEPDTGVLVTELRGREGQVRLVDFMALRARADLSEDVPAASGQLVRIVKVTNGRARLRLALTPRGGARVERDADGLRILVGGRPDLRLHLWASVPLDGLESTHELAAGERCGLVLRWGDDAARRDVPPADALLAQTAAAWRSWMGGLEYEGPAEWYVRRSALTLKLLDHVENGSIVAAPTSSLPEAIGGPRNWDYRYAWIRDAAFSVYALRRIGLRAESWSFLAWVLDAIERGGQPRVLYDLSGGTPPREVEDPELEGYRRSAPVRWGNGAADQRQHDVYGEVLDCAWQWTAQGGEIDAHLWRRLRVLVEAARKTWRTPDHGIWEVRTAGRPFTYSAALCQVALDRGARLAERYGLPGDAAGWRDEAQLITRTILEEAWDERAGALTEQLGGGGLDASVLALPLRRVIPADHPRMVATTAVIEHRLGAGNGLLHRYLPEQSPDGLPGREGVFLLCSFWLVDNLAGQGRLDEAGALFESLCARAGPLGLLPEQIDPASGAFLGNHPQAFSHVGLISSAINLARRSGHRIAR